MRVLFILVLCLAAVSAMPKASYRIYEESLATINQYPFGAAILYTDDSIIYTHGCAGTIITTTAVLSAAHCFIDAVPPTLRVRVGSSYSNSGGTVHEIRAIIQHQNFNLATADNDVAVLRTMNPISYIFNTVAPASISGDSYHLDDNEAVYAIGWGVTDLRRTSSEQLREVQLWTINQNVCREHYAMNNRLAVNENMLCSSWFDASDSDYQCQGDSGSPLIHNNVVVGIRSWGKFCNLSHQPVVNTRVSQYTAWIQAAAAA